MAIMATDKIEFTHTSLPPSQQTSYRQLFDDAYEWGSKQLPTMAAAAALLIVAPALLRKGAAWALGSTESSLSGLALEGSISKTARSETLMEYRTAGSGSDVLMEYGAAARPLESRALTPPLSLVEGDDAAAALAEHPGPHAIAAVTGKSRFTAPLLTEGDRLAAFVEHPGPIGLELSPELHTGATIEEAERLRAAGLAEHPGSAALEAIRKANKH